MKILPALLVSLAVAGPGRADDDVVGGFRQQAQGQRVVAAAGIAVLKADSSIDDALKQEFPKETYGEVPLLVYLNPVYSNPKKNEDGDAYGKWLALMQMHVDPAVIKASADAIQGKLGTAGRWREKKQYYNEVNLDLQFEGSNRNQGLAGSCETFDSVANLEAAYMRQTGTRIHFSEMWPIRASLGEELAAGEYDPMKDVIHIGPGSSFQDGYFLGVKPAKLLSIVKEKGICRVESYPYKQNALINFESGMTGFGRKMSFDKIKDVFASKLGLSSDSRVQACEAQGRAYAAAMKDFHVVNLSNYDPDQIVHLLSFGIPIWTVVMGFPGTGRGNHSVIVTGYNRDRNRYKIRNSWGLGSDEISMSNDIRDFTIIVTPKDIARACADPADAPVALAQLCDKAAGK